MLIVADVGADTTVARKRDQRRMTVSAVAEAGVLPFAAANGAMTWTPTVCPRCIAEVVVCPLKKLKVVLNEVSTASPLVSTRNGFTEEERLTVRRSPTWRALISELVAATEGLSVTTIPNCVWLLGLIERTVPSTKSCCADSNGSISWIEKVPLESRMPSTLATCPALTHTDSVVVPLEQRVPEGSWSRLVLDVDVAVRVPRVGEVMVTELPLSATTPEKSSISAS